MKAILGTYLISLVFLLPFSSNAQVEAKSIDLNYYEQKAMQHYYYERDSAYFYFDQILQIANSKKDLNLKIETLLNITGVASYHYDLTRMGEYLRKLDTLLNDKNSDLLSGFWEQQNILLYYTGDYQLKLLEYSNAINSFETIVANFKKTPDSLLTETIISLESVAYSFLGKIYMLEGKFELADKLYRRNIRNILAAETPDLESLYGHYNLLAEVLMQKGKYREANQYLLKTFGYNQIKNNVNSVITSAFNIAENYNALSQSDSALFFLEKAKSNFENKPLFYPKYHLRKAAIYKSNGEFDSALYHLKSTVEIIEKEFSNTKNSDLPIAMNELGIIENEMNCPEKAIVYFDQALEKATENSKWNRYSLEILKNKAMVLNRMGSQTDLKSALQIVSQATKLIDHLKPSFKSREDKLFLIENTFPLFEMGLEAAHGAVKITGDEDFIDIAFKQMEKSKSILLLEALLASKATEFTDVPISLLEKERRLKSEITFTERELNKALSDTGTIEDHLFAIENEYRQLAEDIENNYKTYFNLKFNSKVVSLNEVQSKLEEDEKLISYFYGNQAIYAIGISKNVKNLIKIPINSTFITKTEHVRHLLADPNSDVDSLAKSSHELYRIILEPFVKSSDATKLTIIADGALNYIPFGALNTSGSGTSYLIEKHSVSYASSATLLEQLNGSSPATDVLAFAPSFDGTVEVDTDRSKLLPLPHNKKEVAQVLHSFSGKSFLDGSATLKNFKAELHNFGVLHFATHAIFNDALPEYSYLAFSQTGNENGDDVLFTADLYNLKTDAALVTLSACETNIGELRRGEGFLSLARGFFFSGAKSIASTLWKVNDASSSEIMGDFYHGLSEGKAKDEALRQAKLLFMERNDQNARKHPYYWAGYIVSGNNSPITKSGTSWPWLLIGTLLTGSIFAYAYRKISA